MYLSDSELLKIICYNMGISPYLLDNISPTKPTLKRSHKPMLENAVTHWFGGEFNKRYSLLRKLHPQEYLE